MRRSFLLKSLLLLCALVAGSSSVWATDGTLTLSSSNKFGTSSGSTKNDDQDNTWTCTGSNIQNTYSNDYSGQQFGTSKTNDTYTFTANFTGYTVTNVSIKAAAGSPTPTYDISVGGNSKKSGSLSTTSTTYSTGTISETGNVVITLNQNSGKKAVYLGQIVVTYAVSSDPSISVTPTTRTVNYDTEGGTLSVTCNKIDGTLGTDIEFYESDGTTSTTYAWFTAYINGDGNVEYLLDENTDDVNDRTAYFKVYGYNENDDTDIIESDLISITQSKFTVDYVTIPFAFDGGKGNLPTGMTQTGLGSNYDNSPKLKFDDQGDNLILKTRGYLLDELSFDIKGNSMSGTYAFKVQWSANGTDYTDLATYTSISTKTNKTIDISSCTGLKDIKWVYTTKDGGNVALGNIKVTPKTESITPAKTYTTLTSAKDLDFTSVEGLKAFIVEDDNATDGKITMTQVNKVPAGTGLVLKATTPNAAVSVPVFDGTGADDVSENKMAGSATEATEIAANAGYILKDGEFHPATAGTLAAGKAYLKIAVANGNAPLAIDFDGETTGVKSIEHGTLNIEHFYDLQGRKVAQPTKGLYIVNGRKVVVK